MFMKSVIRSVESQEYAYLKYMELTHQIVTVDETLGSVYIGGVMMIKWSMV